MDFGEGQADQAPNYLGLRIIRSLGEISPSMRKISLYGSWAVFDLTDRTEITFLAAYTYKSSLNNDILNWRLLTEIMHPRWICENQIMAFLRCWEQRIDSRNRNHRTQSVRFWNPVGIHRVIGVRIEERGKEWNLGGLNNRALYLFQGKFL